MTILTVDQIKALGKPESSDQVTALIVSLRMRHAAHDLHATALAQAEEIERLREALERISDWSAAYPTSVFPEPDMARAAAVLAANGMTLDAISASNIRHAISGAGEIARAALGDTP